MKEIDFKAAESIFRDAESPQLLEHQVYQLLNAAGMATPVWFFLEKGKKLFPENLERFSGERVIVKIASPVITHKSDAGGVKFVQKNFPEVKQAMEAMLAEIPTRYLNWLDDNFGEKPSVSHDDISSSLKGILITEFVDYEKIGFGTELLLGLRNTREFGPVVTMGGGGLDVEFMAEQLKTNRAQAVSAVHAVDKKILSSRLQSLAVYHKLADGFRGAAPLISGEKLVDAYIRFLDLAAHFSALSDKSEFVIEEAEVNPFVFRDGEMVPLDGMCRISRNKRHPNVRPLQQMDHLLRPESIAVIGVSRDMNPGHIIVSNIIQSGFSKHRLHVVKPGCDEIEGCRCFPDVASLPEVVDLFVVTVGAEQSRDIIEETVRREKARSMIIIAGGMAERKGGEDLEKNIRELIACSRSGSRLTPVINGGNCLGVISQPGKYDTTFIPGYKIFKQPQEDIRSSGLVLISQSGAFMISRMAQMPALNPRYAVSIGNQIDLTISDYLEYLKDDPDSRVFAVYVEGFKTGDGLRTARAVRDIVAQGKHIIVYKAGRTREGRSATAGHTASVAGDYQVSVDVFRQAGAFIAENIQEFQNMMQNLSFLDGRKVTGRRVALISNAGFECVIMSDNLNNESRLELAEFSPSTADAISRILESLGINRLQDIKNPLDTTPVADDDVFSRCAEVILQDSRVDCAVVSPLPMTPALNTLSSSSYHSEDIKRPESIGRRLTDLFHRTEKPWVVSLDAGPLYHPLVKMLEQSGVPVFLTCDRAAAFMRQYINQSLKNKILIKNEKLNQKTINQR
jgi:acyl-CoA synthetase (NDP forming)